MNHPMQPISFNSRISEQTAQQPDQTTSACCGGPAPESTDACCVRDADVKAVGGTGCDCGSPEPAPTSVRDTPVSSSCC